MGISIFSECTKERYPYPLYNEVFFYKITDLNFEINLNCKFINLAIYAPMCINNTPTLPFIDIWSR